MLRFVFTGPPDDESVRLGYAASVPVQQRRFLWLLLYMVATIGTAFAAIFVEDDSAADIVLSTVSAVGYGFALGAFVMLHRRRQSAYRAGWLDGRMRLMKGIVQQTSPGAVGKFIGDEQVYDLVHVLGVTPPVPDDASGLERP